MSGDDLSDVDILDMRKLVSALETADRGSSVLDLELKCGLALDVADFGGMGSGLEAEFTTETVELILGEMVTPFTRSLDASLPGENIVFSMFSSAKNLWVSVHRDTEGREFVSWAASEPLSRRAAALRGYARISTGTGKAETVSILKSQVGLSEVGDPGDTDPDVRSEPLEKDAERSDWRIQF